VRTAKHPRVGIEVIVAVAVACLAAGVVIAFVVMRLLH
jgi:hypothetical protein